MHPWTRRSIIALILTTLVPRAAGAQWIGDGVLVSGAESNQFSPVIVPDGAGGAIVSWYDHRGGAPDIYARRVLASGAPDPTWPIDGRALCTAARGQYAPAAVSDAAGGAIVAWHDYRAGSSADIYVQRVRSSGAVDPGWPMDGRGACTASDDQLDPGIVSDGAGGAIVAWRDYRGGPDIDVYAQRVLASGGVDPAWPADGRAICTAPENQSVPELCSDGVGGALVTWSDLRNGAHSDIYVQHVLSSGAVDPAWPSNGRALCAVPFNQSGAVAVADGAGGAIVAWFDYRSGVDADIYAHHVLATGAPDPTWPAEGRALCVAAGEQYSPVLVADGAGGAIVAWYDYRAGAEADIYAQRVRASGVVDPAWPTDGIALCTQPGDQLSPVIVAGSGDAIVAWYDYRGGSTADVYAHRALASGVLDPAWPDDGRALCTATGEQITPAITGDGAHGALIAWPDFRGGPYSDLYAQRVSADGGVVAVTDEPFVAVERTPLWPNPTRGTVAFRLDVAHPQSLTVEVFEPTGRRVRRLVAEREFPTGRHAVTWDGVDELGSPQPSGVYVIRFRGRASAVARKLVLLR